MGLHKRWFISPKGSVCRTGRQKKARTIRAMARRRQDIPLGVNRHLMGAKTAA